MSAARVGVQRASGAAFGKPGHPLDTVTRSHMERAFDRDFSHVRVHTDTPAAASARALDARAYTLGADIAFGPGRYAPSTPAGRTLIAHELAHVVQQQEPGPHAGGAEERADAAAQRVAGGARVDPRGLGAAPVAIMRQAETSGRSASFGLGQPGSVPGLTLTLSTVSGFEHGRATVPTDATAALDQAASQLLSLLIELPAGRITLTGHTDLTGEEKLNERLGRERALSVWGALVKRGVPGQNMDVQSAGMSAPVVNTPEREPRNRRVEIRFEGRLLPEAKSRFGLGGLGRGGGKVNLTPSPGVLVPPWAQPGPATPAPKQPAAGPTPARAATAGDAIGALLKTAPGERALENLKAEGQRILDKTTTGEKVAGGTTLVTIGAGAIAGIWSDPAARSAALKAIDGFEVDVPKVPGLKVRAVTTGQGGGAVLMFDFAKVVPGLP
jgi:outer membrane protein OmpA-like peptidoglycan-associated protein